jgi:D-alanyl-D-alanine carboxypeptidase (penicillin-binding protein 5/6)
LLGLLATGGVTSADRIVPYAESLTASVLKVDQSAPVVIVENPYSKQQSPLHYGVNVAFAQPNFFADTRDSFIVNEQTFLEADLATMQVRFFEKGVLRMQVPIRAKGEKGSWWETPAGLYQIATKDEELYSSFGDVYQPWSMGFQGNFSIHGWPEYESGEPVSQGFLAGCIRLSTEDAAALYELVPMGTPLLVHEVTAKPDSFLYEPKIPELKTPHYLIADIESNTVLASSDLSATAPIASLTKLMTALIAAEYINLDSTAQIATSSLAQSLIPRLGERTEVSMYSLLQLLLVESSNEAADLIADQLGRAEFVERMNEKVTALGLTNTVFADASGVSPENKSSVGDLMRIAQYIYENRRFVLELTKNAELPSTYVSGEFGELTNFNEIDELQNFIGGKVGETKAAGQTSVTLHTLSVKGEERVVVIVLLGSDSRNEDVRQLMRYAEERFGS